MVDTASVVLSNSRSNDKGKMKHKRAGKIQDPVYFIGEK